MSTKIYIEGQSFPIVMVMGKTSPNKIERTNKYRYHLTPIKYTQINQMSYGLLSCFKNIIKTHTGSTFHLDYTSHPIAQNLRGLLNYYYYFSFWHQK